MCFCVCCILQPQQGIGRPSVYHAVVVIFLEFFAWGLLTTPMLTVRRRFIPLQVSSGYRLFMFDIFCVFCRFYMKRFPSTRS